MTPSDGMAFGTGAAFTLEELAGCEQGLYTFDDLLTKRICSQIRDM